MGLPIRQWFVAPATAAGMLCLPSDWDVRPVAHNAQGIGGEFLGRGL